MDSLPASRPLYPLSENGSVDATEVETRGVARPRKPQRAFLMSFAVGVLLYSFLVLHAVAWMGDVGLRCMFGVELQEPVPESYRWSPARPQTGDRLLTLGPVTIGHYADYVKATRWLSTRVGHEVDVTWVDHVLGNVKSARAEVRYRPMATYLASVLWFLQEMVIFAIGARVFWKRPLDGSARLFFWLCAFTVGAYMGGYHWTEIVVKPHLIYPFAAFAVFVPVLSLHFYLVFPRIHPWLATRRAVVLRCLYGVPIAFVVLLWGAMGWSRVMADFGPADRVTGVIMLIRNLALAYIGLAVGWFGLCVLCLARSFRRASTRAERNQVQWILLASLVSAFLIAYLLWQAWLDLATFGRDDTAWPMFGVSLCFTVAYALSITRYKLLQAEELINRGMVYVAFSVATGLLYSAVLVISGFVFRDRFLSPRNPTTTGAIVAAFAVVLIMISSELARGRFQKALDRRFYREKYKFDLAMRKMRVAVGSLVDRETLGRRLLEAAGEVLRVEWGAIYLSDEPSGPFRLAACHGPTPDETTLAADNPLVARLRQVNGLRAPHSVSLSGHSDPSIDAMIALGGEAASALEADGDLAGLLVLGPKRSGMPYEDEELAFLSALGSVATLALHSADIRQTLRTLNLDLRDKVFKIAEQQRRILILQDQLTGRAGSDDGPTEWHEPALAGANVFGPIKGSGKAVRQMIELARKVAASPSAVLIRGESGTGKELLAEAIHAASPRSARPFVKVHCAALSPTLLESELFGHVKGAFTDAHRDRVGRFEQADGGTLFLDEIGDISADVQTKLLRVLQQMSFERVGSSQTVSVDVRILAATHQDLEALIRAGRFREDLYYRLNVISMRTPSLRERKDDIFELAVYFLGVHGRRVGKSVTRLDDDAVEALTAHDWPGNIRELENTIERAVVLADGPTVTRDDLPDEVARPSSPSRRRYRRTAPVAVSSANVATATAPTRAPRDVTPAAPADEWNAEALAFERQRLVDALREAHNNKSEAARLVRMPRSTFCSKLQKHGML